MYVKCLEQAIYAHTGGDWETCRTLNPSWDNVATAIGCLDKFERPYVFLWATDEEDAMNHDDSSVLEIMGGAGDYWLAGTMHGYFQRRLCFPGRGSSEVAVWTSDQGFADAEKHICDNLEVVLQITRYYFDNGAFDPSQPWESIP